MNNDFAQRAIPLLIFNLICLDVVLIGATAAHFHSYDNTLLNATMGAVWGQFALACAARLRYPERRRMTTLWMVGIPLLSIGIFPLIDPTGQTLLMSAMILMAYAITAVVCLAPATILVWLYGREGRQLGIKHLLVFTCLFAVVSFGFSQLDFAGQLLMAFAMFALPSIVACLLLSMPDRPILYSVSMVLFLLLGWGTLQVRDLPGLEQSQEIFYAQAVCLLLGGQFLMAAGRSAPHELDRAEATDNIVAEQTDTSLSPFDQPEHSHDT